MTLIPIRKLNNGNGATLCHHCRTIISNGHTEDLFCCKDHENLFYTIREAARDVFPSDGYDEEYYCDLPLLYEQPAFVQGAEWQLDQQKKVGMEIIETFLNWIKTNYQFVSMGTDNSQAYYICDSEPDLLSTADLFKKFKTL
jgi:hypothetical protein